jgi:hypothetical protein
MGLPFSTLRLCRSNLFWVPGGLGCQVRVSGEQLDFIAVAEALLPFALPAFERRNRDDPCPRSDDRLAAEFAVEGEIDVP